MRAIRSNPLTVTDDVRTARLIACAEAAHLAEWLPRESGRRLVNLCRATRKALAAGDERMAVLMLCDVAVFTRDGMLDETFRAALRTHIVDCLTAHKSCVSAQLAGSNGELKLIVRSLGVLGDRAKGDPA